MKCDEAREAMLIAEPEDLLGRGSGALAEHLVSCVGCAERARMLASAIPPLANKLNARRHRRAAMMVGIPAAAAAVVLGIFIARPDDARDGAPAAIPVNVVSVDVKAGQHAAVLKTSDPTVTVVWISPGGSE
jgi:hypothetical protein